MHGPLAIEVLGDIHLSNRNAAVPCLAIRRPALLRAAVDSVAPSLLSSDLETRPTPLWMLDAAVLGMQVLVALLRQDCNACWASACVQYWP